MRTGIAYGESFAEYAEFPALNASTLVHGRRSMLHLRHKIDTPEQPETAGMRAGQVTHSLIEHLGGLDRCWVVMPDFHLDPDNLRKPKRKDEPITDRRTDSKNTDYYRQRVSEFAAENKGKKIVAREDYEKARARTDAIFADPLAAEIIDQCRNEVSVYVAIEVDDMPLQLKGRMDLLDVEGGLLADAKTTGNVEMHAFGQQFARLNYGFRLAFYRLLLRCLNVDVREVKLITAEFDPPFDVAVVPVECPVLDNAEDQVWSVLRNYVAATRSGKWLGVAGGQEYELRVPNWAMPDDEVLTGFES